MGGGILRLLFGERQLDSRGKTALDLAVEEGFPGALDLAAGTPVEELLRKATVRKPQ